MAGAALPSEVLEIIEAAAAHPEGFALLTGGNAEAVAILFGVRPQAIEAARELAAGPRRRRAMTEALARSRTKRKRPKAARRIPVPLAARGLLEALDAFPGGRELLFGVWFSRSRAILSSSSTRSHTLRTTASGCACSQAAF